MFSLMFKPCLITDWVNFNTFWVKQQQIDQSGIRTFFFEIKSMGGGYKYIAL